MDFLKMIGITIFFAFVLNVIGMVLSRDFATPRDDDQRGTVSL
jgi:hypothetical protein